VFGPTPGNDPTQGATHYYSPSGMPGGKAPYWWTSEAPKGGKTIGRHIFAVRHDGPVVGAPVDRPADFNGQPVLIRRDPQQTKQVMLPDISPRRQQSYAGQERTKVGPLPTPMPDDIMLAREKNLGTLVPLWDPVRQDVVVKTQPPAAPTAKERQIVAGFSVPGGVAGISAVEQLRQKSSNRNIDEARQEQRTTRQPTPKKNVQTVYGPSAQPKEEARLEAGNYPAAPNGPQLEGAGAQVVPRPVAPVMPTPVAQRPLSIPVPQPTLKIVVTADSPAQSVREDPRPIVTTQTGKQVRAGTEYTGTDGYSYRVENDGTITNLKSGSNSGGPRYNADTNRFETVATRRR
jgi:hypothetical protein